VSLAAAEPGPAAPALLAFTSARLVLAVRAPAVSGWLARNAVTRLDRAGTSGADLTALTAARSLHEPTLSLWL
jgi:hypothetical protein